MKTSAYLEELKSFTVADLQTQLVSSPRFRRVRSPSEMVRAFISPTRREAMCVRPRNFKIAFTRLSGNIAPLKAGE